MYSGCVFLSRQIEARRIWIDYGAGIAAVFWAEFRVASLS